jgi:hypothetical protein
MPFARHSRGSMNAQTATQSRRRSIMIRGLILAAVAALLAVLPTVAHADSNTTYDISGTLSNGSTFSGVLDFDTNSSGVTTIVNSTFTIGGITFTCNGASSNTCIVQDPIFSQYFQALSGGSLVVLTWNPINFLNPPSNFSFNGGYCINCAAGGTFTVTGGSGVAAPEPSALAFLVIGLFVVAFLSHASSARATKA